jgi:hypothetical protein
LALRSIAALCLKHVTTTIGAYGLLRHFAHTAVLEMSADRASVRIIVVAHLIER